MLHDMYKETSVLRPIEVVTSVERRRRWSREEKARIVAASFAPGVTVVEVARRHEISPQHLHQWRRAARGGKLIVPLDDEMTFAAVMIDGAQNDRQRASGGVEVEIQGAGRARERRHRLGFDDSGCSGAEGGGVIGLPPGVRVLVATQPVDFRKGAETLAALAKEALTRRAAKPTRILTPARCWYSGPNAPTGSRSCSTTERDYAFTGRRWIRALLSGRQSLMA